jgi:hypothetical protein
MKKSALIIALLVLFAPLTYAEEMPPDVLARIKTKVSAQYPDDFSVQALLINGEKSSYEFLST